MFKTFIKTLFNYVKTFWFLWFLTIIINIITFFIVYFKINPRDETIALKYNIFTGVEWYGRGLNLYLLPLSALIITILNFILFKRLKKYQNFLNFLTIFTSLVVGLIILSATLLLIRVN